MHNSPQSTNVPQPTGKEFPVIDLERLSVTFGGRPILRDLNGELRGRSIGLLGPNGAGKAATSVTMPTKSNL
jgi:ABC-type multidrug transport system ATPase subunit